MRMNCEQIVARLSCYYDGELNDQECQCIEQHLNGCPACRAELAAFEELSGAFACCCPTGTADLLDDIRPVSHEPQTTASIAPPAWSDMEHRLDRLGTNVPNTNQPHHLPAEAVPQPLPAWFDRRTVLAGVLALAAGLLLLLYWPQPLDDDDHSGHASGIAMDFGTIIDRYGAQPALAFEELSKSYAGQEVDPDQARDLLGYSPAVATNLPGDVRLVSTRVLRLPECVCEDGKCTCGPRGCNCTVALCRRSDGSELLLVEHKDSQNIEFGTLASRATPSSAGSVQLLSKSNAAQPLAASWTSGQHRITAIGLRGDAEASALASTTALP